MIAINLINWRAQKILILNRRFALVLGISLTITIILASFVFLILQSQIDTAVSGQKFLDSQLKDVANILAEIKDIEKEKDSLLYRRKTIQLLQASRPLDVEIFDGIARMVPQGVVLNQLIRKGDKLTISGDTDSNYNVSVLIENAQRLSWVKLAKLGQLKTTESNSNAQNTQSGSKISFQVDLVINNTVSGGQDETS